MKVLVTQDWYVRDNIGVFTCPKGTSVEIVADDIHFNKYLVKFSNSSIVWIHKTVVKAYTNHV